MVIVADFGQWSDTLGMKYEMDRFVFKNIRLCAATSWYVIAVGNLVAKSSLAFYRPFMLPTTSTM